MTICLLRILIQSSLFINKSIMFNRLLFRCIMLLKCNSNNKKTQNLQVFFVAFILVCKSLGQRWNCYCIELKWTKKTHATTSHYIPKLLLVGFLYVLLTSHKMTLQKTRQTITVIYQST